jgi:DNA repair protein RecO (recombination protein O)
MKVENVPAYILHSRPFKDSSALLECLTAEHGLVTLVAKGAKRPRSRMQGLLQPFILIHLGWVGKSELKTLTHVETQSMSPTLAGQKILLGLYLNEVLMRLLQHLDPHPQLFDDYDNTLRVIATTQSTIDHEFALRQFELKLMAELGYGIDLTIDAKTGELVAPELLYAYDPQVGLIEMSSHVATAQQVVVSGASIIALHQGQCTNEHQLREVKKLMRYVLSLHLGNKPIESRKLFQMKRVDESVKI